MDYKPYKAHRWAHFASLGRYDGAGNDNGVIQLSPIGEYDGLDLPFTSADVDRAIEATGANLRNDHRVFEWLISEELYRLGV